MGTVSPEMLVPGITLVFKRSAAQEDALQQLLAAQQNTASPLYHQWLTPDTFAARFGTADEDIAATEDWLQSHGFHIDSTARSRDRITFSGTAAQVQAAFGAGLHYYRTERELHFAPETDLTLPTELTSVTAAVLHLSDFRPKPNFKVLTRTRPDFTSPSTQAHYLTPSDIETMYDMKPLTSNSFNGVGQELAVVGQSYVYTLTGSSVLIFQAIFSSVNQINTVLVPGTGVEAVSPADETESEIDLEYSSAIASQANIFLVYVGDNQNYNVLDALAYAITENIAPVVSISYGFCEPSLSQTELDQDNALYEEASAQGQTLVAAAGDSGSTACAYDTSADGITPAQEQALSVQFPASSPNVTAVGGTQMAAGTFTAGTSSYWASSSLANLPGSLLSYVPEVVWNEDSPTNGIAAGGGGTSTYFPRPSWQSGVPGISSGAYRLLPDLALQSSIASPGYLLCLDQPTPQGEPASSCINGFQNSNGQYTTAGGTSFAAPIFAGFLAILNQVQKEAGQGNINPVLYGLAANPTTYATAFHDITSGTNACLPSAATCSVAGESSYAATVGYDEATGLGSVDFNALTTAWPSSGHTSLQPTYVRLISSNSVSTPGENDIIQITVGAGYTPSTNSPNFTVPTGNVSVSVDGTVMDSSLALATNPSINLNGNYPLIAPATTGSHLVTVTYPGDATHSSSAATTVVNVGNLAASGSFTLAAGNLTIANGSTGNTQVTVTPAGGYSGSVVWFLTASNNSSSPTFCYGIGSPPVNGTSMTTLTIGVGSACNSALPAERSNLRALDSRASLEDKHLLPSRDASSAAVFASLLLCGSLLGLRRRIRLPFLLASILLMVVGAGLTGCGGSNNSGGNGGGTSTTPPPATSYTLTLKGFDSVNNSITASTTFTLTVN
ncbi:MAG: protease pro-enzyme activation domain-containing protein [Edaphobacter sp.]